MGDTNTNVYYLLTGATDINVYYLLAVDLDTILSPTFGKALDRKIYAIIFRKDSSRSNQFL